jgi:hypothetical protein
MIHSCVKSASRRGIGPLGAGIDLMKIVPEERHVNAAIAMNAYNVDTNWYTDTGATDHVTSELNKLTVREKYHGND